jgi:hypothetical protein
MSDKAEVIREVRFIQDEPHYDLTCNDLTCKWKESTKDVYYCEELIAQHEQWHEEGCPE